MLRTVLWFTGLLLMQPVLYIRAWQRPEHVWERYLDAWQSGAPGLILTMAYLWPLLFLPAVYVVYQQKGLSRPV